MFTLKYRYQNVLEGEGGEGAAPAEGSVLDDNAVIDQQTPDMNVEQFLSGFAAEDKEKASTYANNYVDESGNLNVAKMIKSGYNLEGKFGSFTGAPESYELPIPEGYEGDVNTDDPYLQEFMAKGKELNLSQDGFKELMDIHLRASVAPPVDVAELEKEIGPEFNAMRANMAGFFKSRLDDGQFKAINGLINSKDSFEALYSIYKASKPTKMDDAVKDNFNQGELKDQMEAEFKATDDHGNSRMSDPVYAKSWRTRWEPFITQSDI